MGAARVAWVKREENFSRISRVGQGSRYRVKYRATKTGGEDRVLPHRRNCSMAALKKSDRSAWAKGRRKKSMSAPVGSGGDGDPEALERNDGQTLCS